MSSILERPLFHYGIPLFNAVIVAIVAITLLDGLIRWAALGIAAIEVVVVPQILKRVA